MLLLDHVFGLSKHNLLPTQIEANCLHLLKSQQNRVLQKFTAIQLYSTVINSSCPYTHSCAPPTHHRLPKETRSHGKGHKNSHFHFGVFRLRLAGYLGVVWLPLPALLHKLGTYQLLPTTTRKISQILQIWWLFGKCLSAEFYIYNYYNPVCVCGNLGFHNLIKLSPQCSHPPTPGDCDSGDSHTPHHFECAK